MILNSTLVKTILSLGICRNISHMPEGQLVLQNANASEDEKMTLESEVIDSFKSKDIGLDSKEISACRMLNAKQKNQASSLDL